jgi:hypothetical protein
MTRQEILDCKFGSKEIEIPNMGNVYIRKWSGKDRAKFLQASISVDSGNVDVKYEKIFDNMALVVALSLCDESGKRMFNDDEIDIVGDLDADVIQTIYQASLEMNSLAPKSIEEAAKNSLATLNEDSISGLQEKSDAQSENSLSE